MLTIAGTLPDPLPSLKSILDAVLASPSVVHMYFHQQLLARVVNLLPVPHLETLSQAGHLLAMHAPESIRQVASALPPLPDSRTLAVVHFAEERRRQILKTESRAWI
jgi:hypothetical protein